MSATVQIGPVQLVTNSRLGPALLDVLGCPPGQVEELLATAALDGWRSVASLAWAERDPLRRGVEDLWLSLRLAGGGPSGRVRPLEGGQGDPARALLGACLCQQQPWMLCDASAQAHQMRLDWLTRPPTGEGGVGAAAASVRQRQDRARQATLASWWGALGLSAARGTALGVPAEAQKLLVLLAKIWLDPVCGVTVWTLGQADPPWVNTALLQRLFPVTGGASLAELERLAFVEVGSLPPAPERCRLPYAALLSLTTLPAPPLPASAVQGYGVERTAAIDRGGLPWLSERLPACVPHLRGSPARCLLLPHLPSQQVRALLTALVAARVYTGLTGFQILSPPVNRPGSFDVSAVRDCVRLARAQRLGLAICDDGEVDLSRPPWAQALAALELDALPLVFVQGPGGGARPRLAAQELLPLDLGLLGDQVQQELALRLSRWPSLQPDERVAGHEGPWVPYALRPLLEPSLALPLLTWEERTAQQDPEAARASRALFAELLGGQQGRGLATAEGLVHLPPPEHEPVLSAATQADLEQVSAYLQSFCTPGQRSLRNLLMLFHGPVGTDKTAAAVALMARHDLPLYRVDLASLMSRWVGETEKNIARVLETSQRLSLPLLFAGANVVFGQRTEVHSGSDRYGNLAVNFMLQAIDSHGGVLIAESEDLGDLDPAFHRRFHCKVAFEMPDADLRAQLWEEELRRAGLRPAQRLAADLAYHEPLTRPQIAFCVDRVIVRRAEGWKGRVADQLQDTVRLMLAAYR